MDDVVRFPASGQAPEYRDDGTPMQDRGRHALVLSATVQLPDEAAPRDVRIRNLSERGVMVEVGRAVAVGTEIRIEVLGIGTVAGRVVWNVDDRIGIALGRSIDPRRARSATGAAPDIAPPRR